MAERYTYRKLFDSINLFILQFLLMYYHSITFSIYKINTASLKMRADLFTSNTEIETKNEEIKKLRQNLKYALAMYENKVEEERERLETNKDKGIQNIPSLLEKSCQVDFVQMKNNVSSSMDVNRLLCGGAKDMKNKLNRYASQSRASLIARRCGV